MVIEITETFATSGKLIESYYTSLHVVTKILHVLLRFETPESCGLSVTELIK